MLCSLFPYLLLTNVDFRASFFDCFPFNFVLAFLHLQVISDIRAVVLTLMYFYRTDAVGLAEQSVYFRMCCQAHLLYDSSAFSKLRSGTF